MASNLFNYESQKLSAEELRLVNSFNSYNFAGVIGKDVPISRDGYDVTLEASPENPVIMLGGGLLLTQTSNLTFDMNTATNQLGYIQVTLAEENGSIITDEYKGIEVKVSRCGYISLNKGFTIYSVVDTLDEGDDPSILSYYEYEEGLYTPSTDTIVDPEKTYYTKYDSSNFAFNVPSEFGNTIYNYNGNTIWVSDNVFIIPICIRHGSEIEYVVRVKDLRDLEGFLSLETYNKLKAYCEGTFVWTVGGQEEVVAPDGTVHKKGDIGDLNITGGYISHHDEAEPITISSLRLENLNNASKDDRIYIGEGGVLSVDTDYLTPVYKGGTWVDGSWDTTKPRYSAKLNLGIFYGDKDPTQSYPTTAPTEGDIYLQIIDG